MSNSSTIVHEITAEPLPAAIFLMGPTAAGKTALAVQLATRFPLEVISVDSAQIYKGMDIGTAKPNPDILARVPHHLLDIREPVEHYSAAEFRADAWVIMEKIRHQGRIPLLVGGTGLYFRALRYGLSTLPPANQQLRTRLELEAAERGWPAMHADLARIDPAAAARIHPHDPQRIERALEVWYLTGRPLSAQQGHRAAALPHRILLLARMPHHREILRTRIAARFHTMLDQGFEQEVRGLLEQWHSHPSIPGLNCVGYRHMVQYIRGEINRERMIEQGITATRGLAKRQITWLRAEANLNWLYDEAGDPVITACTLVKKWLS